HVAAGEVSIERANRIDSQNLDVVAGSKETPLIVVSKNPQWLMLTFDLGSSNFPLQNGFPIFIENVLAWFNREQIALGRSPENLVNPNLSNINRSIFTAPASTQRALWCTGFCSLLAGCIPERFARRHPIRNTMDSANERFRQAGSCPLHSVRSKRARFRESESARGCGCRRKSYSGCHRSERHQHRS